MMVADHNVLMWMNDRCGSRVRVRLAIDCGDWTADVLEGSGQLAHWRGEPDGLPRDDISGLYTVGDLPIDLTHVERFGATVETAQPDALVVSVADGVQIWIENQEGLPPLPDKPIASDVQLLDGDDVGGGE